MEKKTDILRTSQGLFTQFGLRKVTMDDIARKSGISKATIYKYYRNKYKIFEDVVKVETDLMLSTIREAINKETTIEKKLKAFLLTKMSKIRGLINFYRVTRESMDEHWPYIAEVHDRFMTEERQIFRSLLEDGNRIGEFNIKDVKLHAHILVISLKPFEYPWAVEGQAVPVATIVDLIIETLLNGVRKR